MSSRNVIIADNQDITYAGLKLLHGNIFPHNSVARAANKDELISFLSTHPDSVVFLDYTQFDFRSIDELMIIFERFPLCYWLLLSDELSIRFIRLTFFSPYNVGVLLKSCKISEIERAIKCAYDNNEFMCKSVFAMLESESQLESPKIALTPTEKEILKLIAGGLTTKEIAEKRCLSTHTIITHRKNIFRKIDVNNIHEATRYAVRMGLVDLAEYYI